MAREEYDAAQDRYAFDRNVFLTAIPAGILVTLALAFLLLRAILGPIHCVHDYFAQMAAGKLDVRIDIDRQDETAKILDAAKAMQIKLATTSPRPSVVADENLRVRNALDDVSISMMITDNDGKVIYANRAMNELFKHWEEELRKELPQFSAGKLIGSSFDGTPKGTALDTGVPKGADRNKACP